MSKYDKKNNLIYYIIFILLIVIGGIFYYINSNKTNIEPNNNIDINYEEEVKPNTFNNKESVKISIINENGEVNEIEKNYDVDNIEDLSKAIVKDIIISKTNLDININKVYIKNRTLYIDFDNSIKNVKINNIELEKQFIKSIIVSVISNSNDSFDDIQFLLSGEKQDYIFGSINTKNPLSKNPF